MKAAIALVLLSFASVTQAADYTDAMFRHAMAKHNIAITGSFSPSPLFVLINIRESRSDAVRTVCVTSFTLNGALAAEHHIDTGDVKSDFRRIYEIATQQPNREFRFKSRKARELVTPAYTIEMTEKARQIVARKQDAELRREVADDSSELTMMYRRREAKRVWRSEAFKQALAHALLERGILVGDGHDGNLYVEESY